MIRSFIKRTHPEDGLLALFWTVFFLLVLVHAPTIKTQGRIGLGVTAICCALLLVSLPGWIWWLGTLAEKSPRASLGGRAGMVTVYLLSAYFLVGYSVDGINPTHLQWEARLAQWDKAMIGAYPAVLLEPLLHPLLTEVLQIIYGLFYLLPLPLLFLLIYRREYTKARLLFWAVMLCFHLCFVGYLLAPARGVEFNVAIVPLFQTSHLESLWIGEAIRQEIYAIIQHTRDCFPSGHTSVSALLLVYSFSMARKTTLWFYLPVIPALIFSTVYLRYHYLVDVLGGLAVTAVAVIAAPSMLQLWNIHIARREQQVDG